MQTNDKPEFGTRETGMYVPEGFFAEFQKNLEQEIDKRDQKRRISLRRWSIAASIALVAGLSILFFNLSDSPTPASQPPMLTEAASAEVEDLNTEEIFTATISDYDIYEYFYADL